MSGDNGARPRSSGVITGDPLKDLPIGSEIHFAPTLFPTAGPVGFNWVKNWDFFQGAVIALHFGTVSSARVIGSGVIVAPGVALVARHVIEPEIDGLMSGGGCLCSGVSAGGLMLWRPHQITLVDGTDLAILTLTCASALPDVFVQGVITTRIPRVGEVISIYGFRHEADDSTSQDVLSMQMLVSSGRVVTRYERGRDSVLLPGPSLEVECHAVGGMSGGPAFDSDGFLLGILSTSIGGETDGPAFVSLLWPALIHKVTPHWPPGIYPTAVSLIEMDHRLCGVERRKSIELVKCEGTDQSVYRYLPWEVRDPASGSNG